MSSQFLPLRVGAVAALLILGAAFGCSSTGPKSSGAFGKLTSWWPKRTPGVESQPSLPVAATLNRQQKADVQMAVARSLEREGNPDESIAALEKVLEKDDRRGDTHHRLAVLYDQQGEFSRSAEHYTKALQHSKSDAEILCDLGYSQYLQGRFDDAEQHCRKAISLKKNLPRAHNDLAIVLARQGRHADALDEFMEAGSRPAQAHTNLAYVLAWGGQYDAAEAEFRQALALDPAAPNANRGLTQLADVRTKASLQEGVQTSYRQQRPVVEAVTYLPDPE